jgi:arsenate reductase (glutaredoxin)
MAQIARSPRQITVYYDPESCRCAKVLALVRAQGFPIQEIDITREPLSVQRILEIADLLNMKVSDLVNKDHPVYMKRFGEFDFSEEDWAKMLHSNPEVMKTPIVIHGDHAYLISSPNEVLQV